MEKSNTQKYIFAGLFFIFYPHTVRIIFVKITFDRITKIYEYATAFVVNFPTPRDPPLVYLRKWQLACRF